MLATTLLFLLSAQSEIPAELKLPDDAFTFQRRHEMIPMRDGVKLFTVILVPKGAKNAPMLLTRTPYDAKGLTHHAQSSQLGPTLQGYDNATDVIVEGGYIRVVQDVRGKYGSEGEYVMNRPLIGPRNATKADHATDTYDTIEWLIKNVPESNGRVGILGISYDGFLPLMALVNPHPALKVSVPMNPMVDGWKGDDWFHNGAFRQQMMPYIFDQQGTRDNDGMKAWWTTHFDDYDMYLAAGSAGALGKKRGLDQMGFWRKLVEHPAYDAYWRDQAMDKILAREPLKVPVMLVHGLWDQEDIYGAPAVYAAIEPKDTNNDKVFLVMGPWYHGQQISNGSSLGKIQFHADTARQFRREILAPFLAYYLKEGAPKPEVAPVHAFETGTHTWRRFTAWPPPGTATSRLYLQAGGRTGFSPAANGEGYTEYVSDPARPVPFRARPIRPVGYDEAKGLTWPHWLTDDQREASGRPDVAVFVSEPLTAPVKLTGSPRVHLTASTSGTDADWVVKLIDVHPDQVAEQPEMGGYQLMIAADIFRGRYRESDEVPKAIEPGRALEYAFALPNANHVFQPGHRIMVQVQSSWFPLYDRNPQKYVANIFLAQPGDYQKATMRIQHGSYLEWPAAAR